ncbi:MAG: cohesin domain-containing protein [Methanosarcinales archaeon]
MLMFFSVFSITALAAGTTVSVSDASADSGTSIEIPIEITGASNVGSMDLELTYDPKVLNATQVKAGTLTSGTMFQSNLNILGKVSIAIITTSPFNGNGSVAVVTFKVIGSSGETSPLTLNKADVSNFTTFEELKTSTKNGTFTVSGPIIAPPTPPTETPTETMIEETSPTPSEAAPAKQRKIPSFEAIFTISGLLLIAYLIRCKDN